MVKNTYKMACSQNPVEMQVLIGLEKAFGFFNTFTVSRCSVQIGEILEPRPPEEKKKKNKKKLVFVP